MEDQAEVVGAPTGPVPVGKEAWMVLEPLGWAMVEEEAAVKVVAVLEAVEREAVETAGEGKAVVEGLQAAG